MKYRLPENSFEVFPCTFQFQPQIRVIQRWQIDMMTSMRLETEPERMEFTNMMDTHQRMGVSSRATFSGPNIALANQLADQKYRGQPVHPAEDRGSMFVDPEKAIIEGQQEGLFRKLHVAVQPEKKISQ